MVEILLFFICPAISLLLARRRAGFRPLRTLPAEYAVYALALFVVTMAVMVPLERIAVRFVYYDYVFPHIQYGTTAVLFELGLAAAMGIAADGYGRRYVTLRREARGQEPFLLRAWPLVGDAVILFLLVLSAGYLWARQNYGNIGFDEIVFHINMPLEGTDTSFAWNIVFNVLVPAGLLFLAYMLLRHWPARQTWWLRSRHRGVWLRAFPFRAPMYATLTFAALWLSVLYGYADQEFQITGYIRNQISQSGFIGNEYVDPRDVAITFPQKKMNLITIYMESAETSSQDRENGGFFDVNYIPEMTALAKAHVSFSHSERLEGATVAPATGWTISGLVAQTAGLPLKLFRYEDNETDNSMDRYAYFLPGVTSLGDLLREEGYRNIFMAGSDFTFAGRRAYYTQHGEYEVYDYLRAQEEGIIPQDYSETWGFEDRKLYAWAQDVLTEAAASSQPFHFAMLTVDTHAPDGYTCPLCPPAEGEHPYERPLRCSSSQLDGFIRWCSEQPFYEDTVIVVTGDHSSMVGDFYGEVSYNKHSGDTGRKIYNVFINAQAESVREENRKFTTMDFFATTLAAMGVEIEGERLGLSTNLFSDRPTLAEEYGYDTMFTELDKKSVFYDNEILYP